MQRLEHAGLAQQVDRSAIDATRALGAGGVRDLDGGPAWEQHVSRQIRDPERVGAELPL
jgi:hypothetical protein